MNRLISTILSILLICSVSAWAQTTYYVDATNGNDGNSGTSPAAAWRTVSKINSSWGQINTGDDLLFKRGEEFSGTLLKIEKGGTENNPLIIGAYGSGDKPIISNAQGAIRCWRINLSHIRIQNIAIRDIFGDTAISIVAPGLSNITISDCDLDNIDSNGILIGCVDTYTIENCVISNIDNSGICIYGRDPGATNGLIQNNTIYNILSNDGITLHINSKGEEVGSNHLLQNNICFNCAEQGLDITSGSQITLRNNETFNNERGGIVIGDMVDDIWIDKHYSHDELRTGIIIESSTNVKLTSSIIYNASSHTITIGDTSGDGDPCENIEIYNNTFVHNNSTAVIDVCSGTLNLAFKNNVVTSELTTSPGTFLRYLQGKTPNNTNSDFDNNIWWRPDGYTFLFSDPVTGTYDFSTWQSLYSQGSASMMIDPLLEDISDLDFHLQAGSLAINNGSEVALNTDFEGTPIPQSYAPDIGAYEYQMTAELEAVIDATPASGNSPLVVSFYGTAAGGVAPYSYTWDFDDGGSSTQQNPEHTFYQAGEYTVTLTVTDDNNSETTDTYFIQVEEEIVPLEAFAGVSSQSGTAPLLVNFTGSAAGGTAPYSYNWDFGNGATSSEQNPVYNYTQAGEYIVILTVTDSDNTQTSDSLSIEVSQPIMPLVIEAGASPLAGTAPLLINFTGNVEGGIEPYTFSWNFSDGGSSSLQNPERLFSEPGTYSATFTVTDYTGTQANDSLEIIVNAPIEPIQAEATASPVSGTEPLQVDFLADASGGQGSYSFSWDFGDGGSSTEQNPSHTYIESGNYSAVLTVTDEENNTDSTSIEITVTSSSATVQLHVSAATGSPAPGWGGTTFPVPGSYDQSNGSTVEITANPNENYRFGKWTGDISGPAAYEDNLSLNMDQNKSIQANFYTKCGDVNGDLAVSPSDAQLVFEIFLGMLPDATEAQLENADVNTDGTHTTPNVTPADAQAIFEKFLGISELPGDCQCSSRAAPQGGDTTAFITRTPAIGAAIQIKDVRLTPGKEIVIPVTVIGPINLKAFGFDLAFPSDLMEFVGMQPVAIHKKLVLATGNQIADGVLRLGGFSQVPVSINTSKIMFKLVFKVKEDASGQASLDVLDKFDDFKYVSFLGGKLKVR